MVEEGSVLAGVFLAGTCLRHSFGVEGDGAFAYYDTAASLGFILEAGPLAGSLPEPVFRL